MILSPTSFEHLGGIECEVSRAPSLLAAPVDIVLLIAGVGLTLEARPVDQILIFDTTRTDKKSDR